MNNLKVGSTVVFRQSGHNYRYTLMRLYETECSEPVARIQNGIGEMICRQTEIEPEEEFFLRTRTEKYKDIIEAWNAGFSKTKDIAARLSETNLRAIGQRIRACKELGLIVDPKEAPCPL